MKSAEFLIAVSLACLISAGSAYAQDPGEDPGDEGELTIRLIHDPDEGLPEAVTKEISMPLPNASVAGVAGNGNSLVGRQTADDRLGRQSRLDGLATATAARADGRAFGAAMADMAADAQTNRESFSRGNASDLPTPPDLPGGPYPPSPPESPGPP